jgi:hypothetical protein
MTWMLRYRTILLAQTGICSGIHPMALKSLPPQSPASSISASTMSFKERDNNPDAYKKSRYTFRRTIKQAKHQYRTNIESYYTGSDAHWMWQDYKGKPSRELPSDTSLPDELNYFYARFEASNTESCMRAPAVPDDCVITLSIADVRRPLTFSHITTHGCDHSTVVPVTYNLTGVIRMLI